MSSVVEVTVYRGLGVEGLLAERVVKHAAFILASSYSLPVDIVVIEIPADSVEARERGLPTVIVGGRVVVEGRVPGVSEVVDAVFEVIGEKYETLLSLNGFPLPAGEAWDAS